MGTVSDIAKMKERVAATEAILSAAALKGHERNARLLAFLERVENSLVQKQQQISELEEEQSRSREEIERLINMLNNVLTLAETSFDRRPHPAPDDLQQLIDRLSAITSTMDTGDAEDAGDTSDTDISDDEEGESDASSANGSDSSPVRDRRVSKVFGLFSSPRK